MLSRVENTALPVTGNIMNLMIKLHSMWLSAAQRLTRFFGVIGFTCFAVLVAGALPANAEGTDELEAEITKRLPDLTITSIADTPVEGVYELISGGQIYYIGDGGRYIIDGEMIDLETRDNLTNQRLGSIHIGLINNMDEGDMLVYTPENDTGRSITVFTDTTCGFCRKLHQELDLILDAGIAVRYLLFPRAGLGSAAHQNLQSVWCADNPQKAMTIAKSGGQVKDASCTNPIESHVALAQQVGLRGTPLIYLDTGAQVPGYRAAQELVRMVNDGKPYESN